MEPIKTEIVVVGAGPGGYAAAFYAADLGMRVLLVERDERLGGVCLNRGCIPSKALLHATQVIGEAALSEVRGVTFGKPQVKLDKLREWKGSVIDKLAQGLDGLCSRRGVQRLHGRGHFEDSRTLRVETAEGQQFINYDKAIVAVGSKPAMPSAFDLGNPRIMTSTEALELEDIPGRLLVVGGGYIGMELGTVYARLGSEIVLVEALDHLLSGVDADLVRPVAKVAESLFKEIRLKTKVLHMATSGRKIKAAMEVNGAKREETYDRVLVSVGRTPSYEDLGLENTGVKIGANGFIECNDEQQTDDPAIYAVGDANGGALLAHRATKEGRVAVEVIAGESSTIADVVIPAVVFTEPEVAWCGLTEREAKAGEVPVEIVKFPWGASGRALTLDHTEGLTKMILEPETERILGMGITGTGAGELIGEGVLAIEMGATARDLAESVHPHPTLSETLMECAEMFYGTATHTPPRKRPRTNGKGVAEGASETVRT